MKKLLLIMLVMFSFISVNAYENDLFSIDIPEDYSLEINENNIIKWSYKNKYISFSYSDNSTKKYDITKYDEDEINEEMEYLKNKLSDSLTDYKLEVDVTNGKMIDVNGKKALLYDIYWPTKDKIGYDTYQKEIVFTTNNYITTFIYSSDKEITDEEFNSISGSIKIKDSDIEYKNSGNNVKSIVCLILCLALAVFGIYSTIKKAITRKK